MCTRPFRNQIPQFTFNIFPCLQNPSPSISSLGTLFVLSIYPGAFSVDVLCSKNIFSSYSPYLVEEFMSLSPPLPKIYSWNFDSISHTFSEREVSAFHCTSTRIELVARANPRYTTKGNRKKILMCGTKSRKEFHVIFVGVVTESSLITNRVDMTFSMSSIRRYVLCTYRGKLMPGCIDSIRKEYREPDIWSFIPTALPCALGRLWLRGWRTLLTSRTSNVVSQCWSRKFDVLSRHTRLSRKREVKRNE